MVARNRPALEALVEALLVNERVSGDEVRGLVERLATPEDLAVREEAREAALL